MSGEEGWIAIPCTVKLAREKSPTLTSDIRGTKPVRASKVATKSTVQTIPYPEALDPNANRRSAGKVLGGAEPRLVAAAVAARQWWKRRRGAGAAEQQSSRAAEQQSSRAAEQQSSRAAGQQSSRAAEQQGSRAAGRAAELQEQQRLERRSGGRPSIDVAAPRLAIRSRSTEREVLDSRAYA